MTTKLRLLVATLLAWVALGVSEDRGLSRAHATGGFYCESHIIDAGADAYRVRTWCGAPVSVQTRMEVRRQVQSVVVPCARGYCNSLIEREISVQVDDWIYDFGPTRFVQYLTFEHGTLVRVRSGPYGTPEARPNAVTE